MCGFCYVWVCGFCNVSVCVCVGFVMCGCVCVCCNVWVCVCVCCVCVCVCGFCNLCGCVYVWVFNVWVCVCEVFCECMRGLVMCTCIYCVFVFFRLCIFIVTCSVCTGVRTTPTEWQLKCSCIGSCSLSSSNIVIRMTTCSSVSWSNLTLLSLCFLVTEMSTWRWQD